HQQTNIYRLSSEQVADLDRRMTAKIEKVKQARGEAALQDDAAEGADSAAATRGGRNTARRKPGRGFQALSGGVSGSCQSPAGNHRMPANRRRGPMQTPPSDVTQLLRKWNEGDRAALDQLMPVVYQELRKLASGYLREERPDHTLQPTALINEAYLRLV